jgi:NitT/TauT family transport system permease protein
MGQMRTNSRWLGILGALLLWAGISASGLVPRLFLPPPISVLVAAYNGLTDGSLVRNLSASSARILIAFCGSLLLALPTALVIARTEFFGLSVESLIDFLRYVPVPALIPISIVFFGVGETEKMFVLFAGTYFQVVVLVVDAFRRIPQEYFDIFYSLRLSSGEVTSHLLHAAAPDIFDICRVTLGWCWSYVVLAEVIGAESGIGHALELAHRYSNTPAIYLWMILLALLGVLTDLIFRRSSSVIFKFREIGGSGRGPVGASKR